MVRRTGLRALHGLVEDLAELLDEAGYVDTDLSPSEQARRSKNPGGSRVRGRRTRSGAQRGLRMPPKRKRKVSAYQKEFGRQLKRLKKKHPRTPVTRLMKRAHAATRKARR